MAMTRCGARAARGRVGRALGIERLEGRRLLSAIGPAPSPSGEASAVAAIPIPVLVSRVSVTGRGSPGTAEGVGEVMLGDGGIAPVVAGRVTITAPAPPPTDNPVPLPPSVSAVKVVGLSGSMAGATSDPVAIDPGIDKVFSLPETSLTAAPTVAAAWPAVSVGAVDTAEQSGGRSLAVDTAGVPLAVSTLPGPLLPASVAAIFTSGTYGQVTITSSTFSGGEVTAVNGVFMKTAEIAVPQFIWLSPGDATIPAPLPAASLVTSGTFGLAPLFTEVADGSVRITAVVANAPAATAGSGNATAACSGLPSLAPVGPCAATGRPGRVPAADPSPALAGRGLTAMASDRDVRGWPVQDVVAGIEGDRRRNGPAVSPLGPGDLSPQRLGPILDFRPFDRLALSQTIERFLGQLEGLGPELSTLRGMMDLAAELLVLAVALAAWNVVPRILRRSPGDRGTAAFDDATSLDGIAGLAGGPGPEGP